MRRLLLHPEERQVGDFDWLVGRYHMDEGLLYKTTRVVVRRGLIVGFRSLITAGKVQVEDKTPIHIAYLQSLTEEFSRRLRKDATWSAQSHTVLSEQSKRGGSSPQPSVLQALQTYSNQVSLGLGAC